MKRKQIEKQNRKHNRKQNKKQNTITAEHTVDYHEYHFTVREWCQYILGYLLLDLAVSYLFFRSWLAVLLLIPGFRFFIRDRKEQLQIRRKREMQKQFLTGMQLVHTALQAGYAIENAFREALAELRKIYPSDAFIVTEFQQLIKGMNLNLTAEYLLLELGNRSDVEDIQNFAEVFYIAKRTGGDLMSIIRNTTETIMMKQETRLEIETNLSGKIMEQNMMSCIPVFILLYVDLTSPGFLDVMYHNAAGTAIMLVCFGIYILAYVMGKKILQIEV